VTRKRLYLETIETILARSHKVLLDAKGGNGNLIYLPLDKLLERAAAKEPDVATESSSRAAPGGDSDAPSVDSRSRTDR
jgi:membrane protease subunit HflK